MDFHFFPRASVPLRVLEIILLALTVGCAGPRVRVGDGEVEKPLSEATGVTDAAVKQAVETQQVGLWDAYALAVEKTERLPLKAETLEQAHAEVQQAVGAYLPHISLNANRFLLGPDGSSAGTTFSLHANQPILTGLNEVAALQGAGALTRQREAELRFEAGRLLLDVARTYYGTLQLEESLKSEQSILDLTEKTLKEQKSFRSLGRIRESDVLSAEASLARSQAEYTALQDQSQQSREVLANLTGLEDDRILASDDPSSFPEFPFTLPEALKRVETRSDVAAAREAVKVASAQLLAAEGGYVPTVALQGDYFLDRPGPSNQPKWDVGLGASLPIFSGGQNGGRVREFRSIKRQAELNLARTQRSAREEIRQAYSAYQNSLKQDEAYRRALEAAEKSHRAQTEDNRLHLTNTVQYLQSLTDLEQARLNAAKSRTQWRIQRVWIAVATGEWPTAPVAGGEGAKP